MSIDNDDLKQDIQIFYSIDGLEFVKCSLLVRYDDPDCFVDVGEVPVSLIRDLRAAA